MRRFLLFLMLVSPCFAQEIKRPSVNADTPAVGPMNCVGTKGGSIPMANAHDAAGLATSSTQSAFGSSGPPPQFKPLSGYRARIFTTWQTTGNTYSALTLNVNAASGGAQGTTGVGEADIVFSANGGSTWTSLEADGGNGFAQTTFTVALSAAQDLTKLRVAVCAMGNGSDGSDNITVWDIWTSGVVSGIQPGGTGSNKGQAHRGIVQIRGRKHEKITLTSTARS